MAEGRGALIPAAQITPHSHHSQSNSCPQTFLGRGLGCKRSSYNCSRACFRWAPLREPLRALCSHLQPLSCSSQLPPYLTAARTSLCLHSGYLQGRAHPIQALSVPKLLLALQLEAASGPLCSLLQSGLPRGGQAESARSRLLSHLHKNPRSNGFLLQVCQRMHFRARTASCEHLG